MDEPTSRVWSRPELIVLVRGGPEEAVLSGCKQGGTNTGNADTNVGCYFGSCTQCALPGAS